MPETTLLSLRPSRLAFLRYYVVWLLFWIVAALAFLDVGAVLPGWEVPGLAVRFRTVLALVVGFFGLLALLAAEWRRVGVRYVVTDTRILRKDGVFRRRTEQMPFTKIERLQLEQGILQRVLGIGDIVVDTGEDTVTLGSIRHVDLVHDELAKHVGP